MISCGFERTSNCPPDFAPEGDIDPGSSDVFPLHSNSSFSGQLTVVKISSGFAYALNPIRPPPLHEQKLGSGVDSEEKMKHSG